MNVLEMNGRITIKFKVKEWYSLYSPIILYQISPRESLLDGRLESNLNYGFAKGQKIRIKLGKSNFSIFFSINRIPILLNLIAIILNLYYHKKVN